MNTEEKIKNRIAELESSIAEVTAWVKSAETNYEKNVSFYGKHDADDSEVRVARSELRELELIVNEFKKILE